MDTYTYQPVFETTQTTRERGGGKREGGGREGVRGREREKNNSNVKIRHHQRFITPPEGESFRQLKTNEEKEGNAYESRENTNREGRRQQSTQREKLSGNLALAHFLTG